MRTFTIASIILVIWLILSFFLYGTIEDTSKEFEAHIQEVERFIEEEKWDDASKHLSEFKTKWEAASSMWRLAVPHEGIDNIEQSLINTNKFMDEQDKTNSLVYIANLQYYLKDIYLREEVNWTNIF